MAARTWKEKRARATILQSSGFRPAFRNMAWLPFTSWSSYLNPQTDNLKIGQIVKGIFQVDWIYMRVVPMDRPWKGHQPLKFFDFLISLLSIWKDFKVLSPLMQKWIQPPACAYHGLHRILSSYWLAHFYLMKKSAKVQLYFGLDCGMLEFFTHEL